MNNEIVVKTIFLRFGGVFLYWCAPHTFRAGRVVYREPP